MSLQTQSNDAQAKGAARHKARARLRKHNKHRVKWGLTVEPGNLALVSGATIQLNDAGIFSSKYYIDEARHTGSSSGGFVTELSIHRVLKPFVDSTTSDTGN